jgi:flagellar hook-associated protein 1 FlgK
MGIGRLFDISVRTMATYQRALDVASQNISNAGNPDYTRQKVVIATENTQDGIGMGVKIQDVLRIKNDLLDSQLFKYNSSYAESNKRSESLQFVESIIAEPSDHQLSSNTNSIELRSQVIQKAQRFGERFQEIMQGFDSVRSLLLKEASVKTDELNTYLKGIHELNKKIYESEAVGIKASELKDQRDVMITKLSSIANISVQMNDHGSAVVSVGGILAADQNYYSEFSMKMVNGQLKLVTKNDEATAPVLNNGELFAIVDLYSNKIPGYQTQLENLTNVFVNKVNELHQTGYTLVQNGGSQTGIPFFEGIINGKLQIDQRILDNPKNIAVSDTLNNDGNGNIANLIARLADTKFSELGNQSILETYTTFLNNFGLEKVISDNKIESNQLVIHQLEMQKASYSGVSIDEEMTNIIKYQRSYEAAAKLVRVVDEMMEALINMI